MESKEQKKSNINKTWILIAVLIVLTVILLAISVTTNDTESPSPTPTPQAQKQVYFSTLKFAEAPRVSTISGRYELDIDLDTDKNEVKLIQVELEYDPDQIRIFDITPGRFLRNPNILLKEIDPENGRLSYWIEISDDQKWIQGEGSIATLSFTKTGSGDAVIDFQAKTSVDTTGSTESSLNELVPFIIKDLPIREPQISEINVPTNPAVQE